MEENISPKSFLIFYADRVGYNCIYFANCERKSRTIAEIAGAMKAKNHMPLCYQTEAVFTTVSLTSSNTSPIKVRKKMP